MAWGVSGQCQKILKKFLTFLGLGTNVVKVSSVNSELLFQWDTLGQDFTRLIKELIFIKVNNPSLNRNIGKFQLSHILDRVLFCTPGIKVAILQGNAQHSP